jgi:hypothetical protein
MKIAVLGAPGSGKTDFAQKLARRLGWQNCVIDGYVEKLRDETGLEYGHFGNHIDDFQVAFKRREWELALRHEDTITCGTILDTAAHNFVRAEETAFGRREVGLTQARLQVIAQTFGLLYTDTWEYDYAFFLPLHPHHHGPNALVGATLMQLITTYKAPVLTFTKDTDEEKDELAAKAIAALEADDPQETPERGVREGGSAGEEDGDSTESVPDVPEPRADSHDR